MNVSVLKLEEASFIKKSNSLKITASCIAGEPVTGNIIFLKEDPFTVYPFPIISVKKEQGKTVNITVQLTGSKEDNEELCESFIDEENNIVLCGIGINEYHTLSIADKTEYIKKIIAVLNNKNISDFLLSNITIANRLVPVPIEGERGFSKFGGLPEASKNFSFPKDLNGNSALFLFQISVKELKQYFVAPKALKEDGNLYFFASIKNEDGITCFDEIIVKYEEQSDKLVEIALPDDLSKLGTFNEMDIMIADEINIPSFGSSLWTKPEPSIEEEDLYQYKYKIIELYNFYKGHKFLGHALAVQDCVLFETEIKYRKAGPHHPGVYDIDEFAKMEPQIKQSAITWRLLAEIDPAQEYFRKLSNKKVKINTYLDGLFYLHVKKAGNELDLSNTVSVYQNS